MRYPRLSKDETETDGPQTLRFPRSVPGRSAGRRERVPHEAEQAVDRVQDCLNQLDALMDAIPFRREEPDDEGPRAA